MAQDNMLGATVQSVTAAPKSDRLHVESVSRAFRLLEAFANSTRPMSLSQLASAAGVDKSAAQRLCHTLRSLGYLERVHRGLQPGRKLLDRSYDYLRSNSLVVRSHPILVELRRESEERIALSLFDDVTMVYAVGLDSKRDAYYAHMAGRRVPTFCTSAGRAVLARLSDAQILDILARSNRTPLTPKTTIGIDANFHQVKRARSAGYSLTLEESMIGEVVIAAAVTDERGLPCAAVSLAGSLSEWTPKAFERKFGPLVVSTARAISTA
jgi:IclR family transcriptional regulator, pca regulon regulatory protein